VLIDINLLATEGEYAYSHFFIEQLQAFEVWLKFGADKSAPPQQLPVVLQVLLSQVHRVRALELLARFVDLGSWAVVAALSVGIFPYVLKLLQCGTKELRPSLAFIWAKILSVDPVCQHELTKDDGYYYFIQILNDPVVNPRLKIIPAYVMATLIYNNYRQAQEKLIQSDYVTLCMELLSNAQMTKCKMFCLWVLISLGRLWAQFDKARWHAVRNSAYERAAEFLNDDVPEVRAAAVYALGCFVHNRSQNNEHATTIDNEVCDKLCEKCTFDGSVLVRAELAVAIQWFLIDFENRFAELYLELDKKNDQKIEEAVPLNNFTDSDPQSVASRISRNASSFFGTWKKERKNVFLVGQPETTPDVFRIRIVTQINALQAKTFKDPFERIWLSVLRLSFDPYPHVADIAKKLVKHIMELAKNVRTIRHKETSKEMSTSGTSDDGQVKFMVGSPGFTPNMRKLSAVENVSQLRNCTSISDLLSAGMVETSSTVFTPKRNMYGGRSGLYKNVNDDMLDAPVQGLVSTQFVEWCSKSFTEPIYKTIYEESSTSTRNSLVDSETPFTSANMTDWALHTQEGLTQKAHSDAQLLKSEQVHCDMQQMYVVMERMITSIAWSFLRPYVYICDGENTTIYHCSNEQTAQKASTIKVYDDFDDAVSDLMIVNELTHELLITGTRNGLIKVWDPMFSEHSHEIQGPAKMVTAAHLLNDQTRTETRKHPNTTLYRYEEFYKASIA
jgi:regulator-associated protein of mTOR